MHGGCIVIEAQKIGVVEWVEVKRHSRILYIRLSDLNVKMYDLRPGDKLKIKIEELKKGPRPNQE